MSAIGSYFKSYFKSAKNLSKNGTQQSKFLGSPLFNVLLMVTLILGVSGLFRFVEWRWINAQTQIQINDSENGDPAEKNAGEKSRLPVDIFGGEVIETSRRLRETGALGLAVCLTVLDEAKERKKIPGSIRGLLNAVAAHGLLPPGIEFENGEISSASGRIYLRYQPAPLQLELVAVPKEARFGPALMLRFPLTTADGKNIAYFQSGSASNINLPPPFAPAAEVIKAGWTLEAWRGAVIGGENQDFARMVLEEQARIKANAQDNSDYSAR